MSLGSYLLLGAAIVITHLRHQTNRAIPLPQNRTSMYLIRRVLTGSHSVECQFPACSS